jgi:hypothetical protein
VTTGPDTSDSKAAEARAECALFRSRILEAVAEIQEVLAEDLEQFILRSVRAAFLAVPERAKDISDERLAALKLETQTAAGQTRDGILAALAPEEIWLEPGEVTGEAQGLRANGRVWAEIAQVTDAVAKLVKSAGLEAALPAPDYEEPRRFIRSRLLTNLTERYWAALADYQRANESIKSFVREGEKASLAQRWDEA